MFKHRLSMNREVPRILPAESGIQRGMISIAFGGAETSPRRYFARWLIRRIRILHPADSLTRARRHARTKSERNRCARTSRALSFSLSLSLSLSLAPSLPRSFLSKLLYPSLKVGQCSERAESIPRAFGGQTIITESSGSSDSAPGKY
jgi:hypothetical protein